MSPYERRRRGNALPGGPRGHPRRGHSSKGQRGSRHLAGIGATPVGTLSPIHPVRVCARVEPSSKPERSGAYAGQSLSFGPSGKARWGKAKVANRTREIRPFGMKAGARGNVAYGGTRNPPCTPKGQEWSLPPKGARAPVLSRPHICGKTATGKFLIVRRTMRDRMRRKLQEVKAELQRRRHQPIPAQGEWLHSVVQGHSGYYAVPTNGPSLDRFRDQVTRHWHRALRRRSQRDRTNWQRMRRLAQRWIPPVRILHPWPDERFDARTRGKSPVR